MPVARGPLLLRRAARAEEPRAQHMRRGLVCSSRVFVVKGEPILRRLWHRLLPFRPRPRAEEPRAQHMRRWLVCSSRVFVVKGEPILRRLWHRLLPFRPRPRAEEQRAQHARGRARAAREDHVDPHARGQLAVDDLDPRRDAPRSVVFFVG